MFVYHDGRRKAKSVGDKETARRLAQALRDKLALARFTAPPEKSEAEVLRSYASTWMAAARINLKASTISFYQGHLGHHILPALGSLNVRDIRRSHCRDLVLACRAKGLKVATVRGIARTLSTILSQAVEDELLPANPALRMGKHLRRGDDEEPRIDPLTREESAALESTAQAHFPEWYPWLLTGLRTGMRSGELLGLQWGDIDWQGGVAVIARNIVRGQMTTPKNHQRRRVDLSRQLQAVLRWWRASERRAWLKKGVPRPEWVFASVYGTALDESNVRKALNRMLDRAGLRRRGPHQLRHTFASQLLAVGAPITYVSRQLGHHDASITLRVYAHWLPEISAVKGVDRLDETQPDGTPAAPGVGLTSSGNLVSPLWRMVSQTFASWNQMAGWLRAVEGLRHAA